jgi:hypothetical protein
MVHSWFGDSRGRRGGPGGIWHDQEFGCMVWYVSYYLRGLGRVGIILRKDHFKKHMLLTQKGFHVATLVCRVVRKVD